MALRYILRETSTNIRRNIPMTLAAILTVAVSLFLVGGALMLRQGVVKATLKWRGGIEMSVFMDPTATPSQTEAVKRKLTDLQRQEQVKKFKFVDKDASYVEFKRIFANSPELVDTVRADDLPPSFRVVPQKAELVRSIGKNFEKAPGAEVTYAEDEIKDLLRVTNALQIGLLIVAAALLISAVLLILTSIQMAIFARRREVAVMKLVGASNWYIRIPFMIEGMVHGVVGAGLASLVVAAAWKWIYDRVADSGAAASVAGKLLPVSSDLVGTSIFVIIIGVAVGSIGSGFAVRRFLDV